MRRGLDVEVGIILHSVVSRCSSLAFSASAVPLSSALPSCSSHSAPFLLSSFCFHAFRIASRGSCYSFVSTRPRPGNTNYPVAERGRKSGTIIDSTPRSIRVRVPSKISAVLKRTCAYTGGTNELIGLCVVMVKLRG